MHHDVEARINERDENGGVASNGQKAVKLRHDMMLTNVTRFREYIM